MLDLPAAGTLSPTAGRLPRGLPAPDEMYDCRARWHQNGVDGKMFLVHDAHQYLFRMLIGGLAVAGWVITRSLIQQHGFEIVIHIDDI
jgi:hypothetical protein